MKLLLIFIAVLFASMAMAQSKEDVLQKKWQISMYKKQLDSTGKIVLHYIPTQYVAPGLYTLKQDKMPCKVPNTKAIAPMPNAVAKVQKRFNGIMPNPYPADPLFNEDVIGK